MRLDYSLRTYEERKRYVDDLIATGEKFTQQQLGYMADYLLFVMDGRRTIAEKNSKYPIVTKNRDVTVTKRQISYEETVSRLQNGEDGLYALIINDKDVLMDVREPISQEDIDNIPGIRENLETIESIKKRLETAKGRSRYTLKRDLISKYQELYTIKASFTGRSSRARVNSQVRSMAHMPISEKVVFDENGMPKSEGFISLLNQSHVAFLLKYYQLLKEESWEDLNSDMRWLLIDLEDTVVRALLPDNEILYDLLVWEIDGCTGAQIAEKMMDKYGVQHSEQYFSTLWCRKIPKMVAEQAQKDWLIWHYKYEAPEEAVWKTCKTCGQTKLAHPMFFHKNTSKDGFYSKCRECRSKKRG